MQTFRMSMYVPVIRRFVLRVLLYHAAVAARLELNPVDVSSIRLLGEEPLSPGELSGQIALTGAATTALIDRLERSGFVVRERSTEDRRRVTVHADQRKLREINALYAEQGVRMRKLLSSYSAEEFRTIVSFLEKTTLILAEEAQTLHRSPPNERA